MSHLRDALAEDIALFLTQGADIKDTSKKNATVYLCYHDPLRNPRATSFQGVELGGNCYLANSGNLRSFAIEYSNSERIEVDITNRFPNSIQVVAQKILEETFGAWKRAKDLEIELEEVERERDSWESKTSEYALELSRVRTQAREAYERHWIDLHVILVISAVFSFSCGLVMGLVR